LKPTLVVLALLLFAGISKADTTYDYVGSPFTYFSGVTCPPECNVTGSFSVAQPLPANMAFGAITPTTFSFTDGAVTITPLNYGPGNSSFSFGTDASGAITFWNVTLTEVWPPNLITEHAPFTDSWGDPTFIVTFDSVYHDIFAGGEGYTSTAGTWTEEKPIGTPEPSSVLLLASGLGLLGLLSKKTLSA